MEKTEFVQITRQSKIAEKEFYPIIHAMYEQIWQNRLPSPIPPKWLTVKRANNIITPPDAPVPDCVTCGICCEMMLCVGVRPNEDVAPEDYWDITIEGKNGEITVDRYLRRDGKTLACQQLKKEDGKTVCNIYEQRPQMCRDFDAGSDKCHALRQAAGYEPFLSFEERREAFEKLDNQPPKSMRSDVIEEVKFVENAAGCLEINASLNDGTTQTIHTFNPENETWRQFEFDSLTLMEATDLISLRTENS